ncbi:RodZ domain-containing protein [Aggregatilineales bacterium SYSU G02658]
MNATELGRYLREAREAKELTLDNAHQTLRIRRSVLEAFESGSFNVLETPVQVRGALRSYARYLGLEEERVLALYENAMNPPARGKKRATQEAVKTPPNPTPPPLRRRGPSLVSVLASLAVLLTSVAALGVIAVVVVEFIQTPDDSAAVAAGPTPNLLLGTVPPTFTFTPTWTPRPLQPTATPLFTGPLAGDRLRVDVNPTSRTWVRVLSDGQEVYAGILRPSEAQTYEATSRLDLIASNAAALDIRFNGQQQGRFGLHGQQVGLVFTTQGVDVQRDDALFQPTPEASPTPPPTPTDIAATAIFLLTPSPTPGPSPTPTETPVPSDTPTLTPFPTQTFTPTVSPTPSLTFTPTLTATLTPLPTDTPTATLTPTITNTPTPTAILPPRVTLTPNAATKTAP